MAIMLSILDVGFSFFAFAFLGGNADFSADDEGDAAEDVDDATLGAVEVDTSGFGFGFEVESWPSVFGFLIGLAGVLESCEVTSRFLVDSSLAVDEASLWLSSLPSLPSLASLSLDP